MIQVQGLSKQYGHVRAVDDDYLAQKKAGKYLSYQYEFHEFHDKA